MIVIDGEATFEGPDAKKNAARYLAAKALLEALKGIMSAPLSTKAMLAAHAAIAKADGER